MRRDDRGVAAVEFAIVSSLLMLLVFGALPLYAMARSYQRVSKVSGSTLRYATAVAPNGVRASDGTLSRRPSYDQIQAFARDAADDPGLVVVVEVCKGATCVRIDDRSLTKSSPIPATSGDTVNLTVSTTVDMQVLGGLANAASRMTGNGPVFDENDVTIASTASAREE